MKKQIVKTGIAVLSLFIIHGCEKETITPECNGTNPTYEGRISDIIDANCTGSACHGSGSPRGDWTSYSTLEPVLNDGSFKREVLVDQTMPKTGSLTQEELNTIQCWVDNGYPKN